MIQKTSLAVALALGLTAGCLGPNNAHNSLRNWNAELSDQDWVNELAFLGLHVVPVYPLAYLGDVLLFNTIDYWGGENTINDPGPFPGFGD